MKEKHNPSKISENTHITPNDVVLIAGLGNPGKEYENTYHNAGLMALHYIADTKDFVTANTGTFAFANTRGESLCTRLFYE